MGRALKDVRVQDRSVRARLPVKRDPYWRLITQGFHLGYYRGKLIGTWVARFRQPGGPKNYVMQVLGEADDRVPADGENVLSWGQAYDMAQQWVKLQRDSSDAGLNPKITVAEAVKFYIAYRDNRDSKRAGRLKKSDASSRLERHVLTDEHLPQLKLTNLSEHDLRNWQRRLEDQKGATKQRLINDLKAALNMAFIENRLALPTRFDATIKVGLKPVFDGTPSGPPARANQVLTDDEVRAIVREAEKLDEDGDFARMVLVLAATGARFSQVSRMLVRDVQPGRRRLLVPHSRKGGPTKREDHIRVPVGADVIESLVPVIEDRDPGARLLEHWRLRQVGPFKWEKVDRGPWKSASEMTRKWRDVAKAAGQPEAVPYALRHSSIVRGLAQDLPIRLVAALHDTSVAMIERHYSRWITDRLDNLVATAVVPMR
jgi:integrase